MYVGVVFEIHKMCRTLDRTTCPCGTWLKDRFFAALRVEDLVPQARIATSPWYLLKHPGPISPYHSFPYFGTTLSHNSQNPYAICRICPQFLLWLQTSIPFLIREVRRVPSSLVALEAALSFQAGIWRHRHFRFGSKMLDARNLDMFDF